MILWFLCFTLSFYYVMIKYRMRRNMDKWACKIYSYRKQLPVIGFAHKLIGDAEDIMTQMKQLSYDAMANNGTLKAWFFHLMIVVVVDQKDAEKVLKTCLEKNDLLKFSKPLLGNSSVYAPCKYTKYGGDVEKLQYQHSVSPKIIENFGDIFAEQSEILASRLADRAGAGKFSLWPFVNSYALDTISQTVMGVKINAQVNHNTPFLVCMSKAMHLLIDRIFHIWLHPEWIYRMFPQYKEAQACVTLMHDFTNEVIRKKREELKINETTEKSDPSYDLGNYMKKTFLEHLINLSGNKNGFTDTELREEVITIIIAATETVAIAVAYILMMLAKYPDVQKKVYKEIYNIFGDSNRELVKEDLTKLEYLERVVKETVRLFPPAPFIGRKVEENVVLPSGGVLPAGAGVVISIWGVLRDPKYWGPEAEKFDPDRFLPERLQPKEASSFIPFSQGPRSCLGHQYALMSIKTAITAILRKCVVVPEREASDIPHIRTEFKFLMKDVDGFQIGLQLREPTKHAHTYLTKDNIE